MKTTVRLLLLVAALSPAFAADGGAGSAAAPCRQDADCKLLYSSCLCESVAVSDPRRSLPGEVDCAVNRCRYEHARAVCMSGACATESDPPKRGSR